MKAAREPDLLGVAVGVLLGAAALALSSVIVGVEVTAVVSGILLLAMVAWDILVGWVRSRWGWRNRRAETAFWRTVDERRWEVRARFREWDLGEVHAREMYVRQQEMVAAEIYEADRERLEAVSQARAALIFELEREGGWGPQMPPGPVVSRESETI